MAHHQGMSVVAVANVIFEGRMRDRFHSDQVIEAAELLLQEKAPRDILISTVRTEAAERGTVDVAPDHPDTRLILNPALALKATNVMSNGQYSVMVTATGAGYSRFGDISVTRWQADPTEDRMGTLPVPARRRKRRMVVGNCRAEKRRGRDCPDAFQRRQGKLRQDRRRDPIRGRVHRRIGRKRRGAAHHHLERQRCRSPRRGHLLCRAGAGAGRCRQRASGLLQDVRRNRDRRRQQRHLRAPASALARRTGHRACAFRRGQFRLAARHRSRNRPPRLPRPRPIDRRSGSAAARRQADRQRRLRARSGDLAAPAGARAGPQEGDGDVLDGGRQGARRSRGDDVAAAASRELRAPDDAVMDPLASADPPCRAVACRRGQRAAAGPLPALSRRLHASAGAGARGRPGLAIVAVADQHFRRLPDLCAEDRRRRRPRDRRVGAADAGVSARPRRDRRPRHRQRAGILLRAGPAAGDRVAVREQPRCAAANMVRASISSRYAATSWTIGPTARCWRPHASCCTRATGPIFDQIERAESGELQPKLAAHHGNAAGNRPQDRATRRQCADRRGRRAGRLRPCLLERLWWLRRWWARICRAPCRRALDPASLGERHRQFVVRLPHVRRGRVLHLEPQQPRLPADAVDQRPRAQPPGRSDLHLRPGVGAGLLAARRRRPRPRR